MENQKKPVCFSCGVIGYLWNSEKRQFLEAKRKLKYFFDYDISGKQTEYYYCQNEAACQRDKRRKIWKI